MEIMCYINRRIKLRHFYFSQHHQYFEVFSQTIWRNKGRIRIALFIFIPLRKWSLFNIQNLQKWFFGNLTFIIKPKWVIPWWNQLMLVPPFSTIAYDKCKKFQLWIHESFFNILHALFPEQLMFYENCYTTCMVLILSVKLLFHISVEAVRVIHNQSST